MQKATRITDNVSQGAQTHLLMDGEHHEGSTGPAYLLFNVTHTHTMLVTVELNQTSTNTKVDTGASASLISKDTYDKLWPNSTAALPLKQSGVLLWT